MRDCARRGVLMRLLMLLMATVMLAGAAAAYFWREAESKSAEAEFQAAQAGLEQMVQQVKYRAALGDGDVNGRGWPLTIDKGWFNGTPPRNTLLSGRHPWVQIAGPAEYDLDHPPSRVALDETSPEGAGFWYNPGKGIVRARVGPTLSDKRAIELYNRLNGTSVDRLFTPVPRLSARADGEE